MQLQPHLTPCLLDSEAATPLLHPLRVPITAKPSNLTLERMFVRLGLLHYCPVFAGTKLTNPILCETEKRKNAKTLGVTRFQKPAVLFLQLFFSLSEVVREDTMKNQVF